MSNINKTSDDIRKKLSIQDYNTPCKPLDVKDTDVAKTVDNKATLESVTLTLSPITCSVNSSWNTYEIKGIGNQGDVILRFFQTTVPTASKIYNVVSLQDLDTGNDVYIETKPIFQGTATSASSGGKLYLTVFGNQVKAEYCNIEFLSTAGSLFGSGRIICN